VTGINQKYFQGLSVAIDTVRIVKELVEIWPNEVYDTKVWVPSDFICGSNLLGHRHNLRSTI